MDARVECLEIAGHADAWRSIGLVVSDDGLIPLHGTSLRIVDVGGEPNGGPGITGWVVSGVDEALDGTAIDDLSLIHI